MVNFSMISEYAVLFGSVGAQHMTLLPFREGKISAPSHDGHPGFLSSLWKKGVLILCSLLIKLLV